MHQENMLMLLKDHHDSSGHAGVNRLWMGHVTRKARPRMEDVPLLTPQQIARGTKNKAFEPGEIEMSAFGSELGNGDHPGEITITAEVSSPCAAALPAAEGTSLACNVFDCHSYALQMKLIYRFSDCCVFVRIHNVILLS